MTASRPAVRVCLAVSTLVFVCAAYPAVAETPGEIPKPWTYEGSMKLQEQERQRDQQFQQRQSPSQEGAPASPRGNGRGAAAAAAAADAARSHWLKQPPLPPERNPLLGKKWSRPASTRARGNDPFGQLQALAKGGLCEVLFGDGGVFEFQPDRLVGRDQRTPPQELDRVEYRGDAKHVVVLPKATVKLMEFDVEGADRIDWKSQNCVLVQVGTTKAASAGTQSSQVANAAPSPTLPTQRNSTGVLALAVAAVAPDEKIAGRKLWVLKADPQLVLTKGGITSTRYGGPLQTWMQACASRAQACQQGVLALKPYTVGIATTDATGHANTPPLPTGRYWILSDAKIDNRHVMWNQPVDVKGTNASVTLDGRNVMPVE